MVRHFISVTFIIFVFSIRGLSQPNKKEIESKSRGIVSGSSIKSISKTGITDSIMVITNQQQTGNLKREDYSYWLASRRDSLRSSSATKLQIVRIEGNILILKDSTKVIVKKPD
jgi:hypothetical protein